ncbi:MFS transporter [Sulfobacillus harzensis]|uniref:MFS transporter n=1 Tax=Sulfobacillus harzensis TaxID=2729629 RepID=A0A7Y0L4F2_9FIRM|nr:MFS transporter [Sulfobacillus harzensis]NMP23144.1 MFS transporter [Sulfobacillus harzensis]
MLKSQSLRLFYLGVGFIYAAGNLWATFLLWQVLAITRSGTWVALAAATSAVPALIVGLTGPEWGFKGKMGLWLLGVGIGFATLAPWFVHSAPMLLAVGLAEGWINARIIPKAQAWLMSSVPSKDAASVSSRFEMASRIGIVAGPLLAGGLITISGAVTTTLGTACLFLGGGWFWYGLDSETRGTFHPSHRAASWRAVQKDGFLLTALGVRAGANLLWPAFTVAIPLLMRHPWHAAALGYGVVRTLWGLSTVLGTWLVIPRLFKQLRIAYFLSWVLTGIAFWRIGLAQHLTIALIWVIIGALSSPIVHVALDSHIGTRVEPPLQGGVFAIQRLVMAVVNLIGLFLLTGAMRRINPGSALSGAGLIMALAALVGLLLWVTVRRPRRQPHPTDQKA